jgi:hypothetical protein
MLGLRIKPWPGPISIPLCPLDDDVTQLPIIEMVNVALLAGVEPALPKMTNTVFV